MNWNEIIKAAVAKQKTLLEAAKKDERAFTDAEQVSFDALSKEVTDAKSMLAAEKAMQDNTPAAPAAPATPAEPAPAPTNTGGGIPTAGQNVRIVNGPTWKNGIGSLMSAVAKSSLTGNMDERFTNAASGGNETVPEDGGFLVGSTMVTEILKKVYENSVLAGLCRRRPVSNGNRYVQNYVNETSRKTGSRMGGIRGYWVDEAGTIPDSKPKFGQIDLKLAKLVGLYYATEELLADSIGLQSEINGWFSDEFAWLLDEGILNGTGTGQPKGILGSNALITVAKESGQSAKTIVFENITRIWSRMWAKGRQNAVWLINQNIEPQLQSMALSVGTGGIPVYLPANGLSDKPYSTLMGRPVLPIEQAETLGTKGDISLMDLDSYLLIDKAGEGVKGAQSMHVKFDTDEMAFRFTYRVNGQPIWQSPVEQAKSVDSLSAFVTLANR